MTLRATTFAEGIARSARYAEKRRAKLAENGSNSLKSRSKPLRTRKSGVGETKQGVPKPATSPKNRGKRTFRRGIRIDLADKYFSLFVRYRDNWTCQRCQKSYEVGSQGLHNSHHFGRARENTRFDPVNCDALCHGCHSFFTANPHDHCAWKLARIGQAEYDKLTIRANTRCKKDRKLMAMVCKQMADTEEVRFEAMD